MKILFLTHTFPYPLNDGVRLHIYHILRCLAGRHQVFLSSLNDVPVTPQDRDAVQKIGVTILDAIHHSVPKQPWKRAANTLFDSVPFLARQFESQALRDSLKKNLAQEKFDCVHVDYLSMALYLDLLKGIPKVFFPHDSLSMLYERNLQAENNIARKLYTALQWRKILQFEKTVIPQFNATMVVSDVDANYWHQRGISSNIFVSPNGVDADYFCPQAIAEEDHLILFRGVMNFIPNSDAARYFYQNIFPLIREQNPHARFCIVGKDPPADLVEAAKRDPQLVLTGFVEDLRIEMARAALIVSPMRVGSGIKNKILEPMAMGKAIVATALSVAGLKISAGEAILFAETAQEFAQHCLKLMQDTALRRKIGAAARQCVLENYTWERNAADFEKLYRQAQMQASRGAAPLG